MTRCLIGMALVSGAAFLAATGEALTVVRCGCRLKFALDGDGRPTYAIRYGDRDVVRPSTLGFETDGYPYRNAKGREVLLYLYCL